MNNHALFLRGRIPLRPLVVGLKDGAAFDEETFVVLRQVAVGPQLPGRVLDGPGRQRGVRVVVDRARGGGVSLSYARRGWRLAWDARQIGKTRVEALQALARRRAPEVHRKTRASPA